MKNSNEIIGNRTRDLPACSAVPQPTAPPRAPTIGWVKVSKGKGVPRQAEVAQGVPGSLRPRIILTFRHYKGGRSSAKRTDRL